MGLYLRAGRTRACLSPGKRRHTVRELLRGSAWGVAMRPMTINELDMVRARCRSLVNRRSATAGVKAATIGSGSLPDLVAMIGEAFGLSEVEVAQLAPEVTLGLGDFAETHIVSPIKNGAYMGKVVQAVGAARKARSLRGAAKALKSGLSFSGPVARKVGRSVAGKAAKKVATAATGKAARAGARKAAQAGSKGSGVGAVVVAASIAVGTAGYYQFVARRYINACYALIESELAPIPESGEGAAA